MEDNGLGPAAFYRRCVACALQVRERVRSRADVLQLSHNLRVVVHVQQCGNAMGQSRLQDPRTFPRANVSVDVGID
jgi:hypothetical protein